MIIILLKWISSALQVFPIRTPFLQASIYTVIHIKSTNAPDKTSKKLCDFLCLVRHYTTVYTKVLPAKPAARKAALQLPDSFLFFGHERHRILQSAKCHTTSNPPAANMLQRSRIIRFRTSECSKVLLW